MHQRIRIQIASDLHLEMFRKPSLIGIVLIA